MANTYTSINLHLIFAVKNRESIILPHWLPKIHSYIAGVLSQRNHHPIIVGGVENHVHILFTFNVNDSIPDLVREIKTSTAKFIRRYHITPCLFNWQTGYACFSCRAGDLDALVAYIANQAEHHKKVKFREELTTVFSAAGIPFSEQYLMEDVGYEE